MKFRFMTKKILYLLCIFAALGSLGAQDKAEKALETFSEKYPQEKNTLSFQ